MATFSQTPSGTSTGVWYDTSLFNNSSAQLTVGDPSLNYNIFLFFSNVTIAQGSTVTNATITFTSGSAGLRSIKINGSAEDDSSLPSSFATVDAVPVTTAFVNYSTPGPPGASIQTSNFATVVSEIVNRPGWVSGNDFIIFFRSNGDTAYDISDGTTALNVTYTAPTNIYNFSGSGSMVLSGTGAAAAKANYTASGSGTLTLSGSPSPKLGVKESGSGTLSFSGAGAAAIKAYRESGSGTLTFSGAGSTVVNGYRFSGSGPMTLSGAADAGRSSWEQAGSGTMTLSGTASARIVDYRAAGSGTLTLSGQGQITFPNWSFAGSGLLTLSGDTTPKPAFTYAGSGPLTLSGQAPALLALSYAGSGPMTLSGEAGFTISGHYLPTYPIFDNGYRYRKRINVEAGKVSQDLEGFAVLVVATLDDHQTNYKVGGTGSLTLSGSAGLQSSAFTHAGAGALTLSSESLVVSCGQPLGSTKVFSYQGSGSMSVTGSVLTRLADNRTDFAFELDCSHEPLDFEIEEYNAVTGQLTAWVRLPDLFHLVDNGFYLCYGHGAGAAEDPAAVWQGYQAVYHLSDYHDSANAFDAEATEAVNSDPAPHQLAGKIVAAQRFDGGDYLTASDSITSADDITAEAWVKPTASFVSGRQVILSRGLTDVANGYGWSLVLGIDENRRPWAAVQTTCNGNWTITEVIGPTALTVNSWACLAAVWTSGDSLALFVNGQQVESEDVFGSELVPYSGDNQLGRRDLGQYIVADLDEVRLASQSFSSAWLKASYDTTNDPTTFALVGPQETALHLSSCPLVKVTRKVAGSGILTLSGGATAGQEGFGAAGSGVLTLSGSAKIGRSQGGSGSISLSGAAACRIAGFKAVGQGSLALSGNAGLKASYRATGAGKLTLAGNASINGQRRFTGQGSLSLTGSAWCRPLLRGLGTGALSLSGSGKLRRQENGSISLTGSAVVKQGNKQAGSGSIALSGSAPAKLGYLQESSGAVSLTGSAATRASYIFAGSGSMSLTGQGKLRRQEGGSLNVSGSAVIRSFENYTGSGRLSLTGLARIGRGYLASGQVSLTGEAGLRNTRHVAGEGELTLTGSAGLQQGFSFEGGDCDS